MKFKNCVHYNEPARLLSFVDKSGDALEVCLVKKGALVEASGFYQIVGVRMTKRRLRSFAEAILKELA